jgi:TolB protein
MTRFSRAVFVLVAGISLAGPAAANAQDTTFRGITLLGNYNALRDKIGVLVLPITGAFGDSVRAIVQRDLDYSDRFTVVPMEGNDPSAWRAPGNAAGLNYPLFASLAAAAVVEITPVGTGLHVVLHDVAGARVVNVGDYALPPTGLNRDWRLAVHRVSDEVHRWVMGQPGIAATRIAYMRGASIRIVDSDGADEITVPTDPDAVSPAWNSAGTMVVYNTFGAGGSRLMIIDLTTGRSRTLATAPRNTQYMTPVFSPDGNTVVFARSGENGSDLFSIGVSGTDAPRRITAGQGTENNQPTASRDGHRYVFTSGRLGRPELYITDADGTNVSVLTDYDFSEKNYRSDADWSSDGRLIAYQEKINDHFQIRTIPASGGTPKLLTSEGENEQPSWAPDSRHLIFTSNRTSVRQLWVLDTESGRLRQLTKSAGSRLASWSPRLNAQ